MNALCAGLALLGLCLPLPGQPLHSVESAGWKNEGGKAEWFSTRFFSSGTYQLSVVVKGDGSNVIGVTVSEERAADRGDPNSPLSKALSKACSSKNGQEQCALSGRTFSRMPCIGGWLLFSKATDEQRIKAKELCERVGPLFEDARRNPK